jgi:hypothetical protein
MGDYEGDAMNVADCVGDVLNGEDCDDGVMSVEDCVDDVMYGGLQDGHGQEQTQLCLKTHAVDVEDGSLKKARQHDDVREQEIANVLGRSQGERHAKDGAVARNLEVDGDGCTEGHGAKADVWCVWRRDRG